MAQNSKNSSATSGCGCDDCKDKDNATQKSITAQRQAICNLLYVAKGNVEQQQTKSDGQQEVLEKKKCLFVNTEENYRRYRNLDITVGTELLQTNDSLKASVASLSGLNTSLNKALTDITKQIKDAKSKFADLKSASCKLEDAINDKCNAAQWKALTGKSSDSGNDDAGTPVAACANTESEIDDLVCLPKGLTKDIDYIFQSSCDVTGIQVFSNIDTLAPLQQALSDKSVAFEKLVSDTMKTRKGEVDKLQDDLVATIKSVSKTLFDKNSMRSDLEGYLDTTAFLCCPKCDCVNTNPNDGNNKNSCDDCNPRLQNCESKICDICKDVQATFCCDPATTKDSNC